MTRRRDERGQGGAETLAFGFLVFVVGALLVANAWGVIDTKFATEAAAREAARAYVEAPSEDKAEALATAAAEQAIEGHGRDKGRMEIVGREDRRFERCRRITFEVRYDVPAVALPWIGGFGRAITAVGRHSEIVDPYRSGLPGEARCQ